MKNGYRVGEVSTSIYLERHDGSVLRTLVQTSDLAKLLAYDTTWFSAASGRGRLYVYGKRPGETRQIALARFIMDAQDGEIVDHMYGDTLDNRRNNLRKTDRFGNTLNLQHYDPTNRTGFRGVYKRKGNTRFEANLKGKYLGSFDDVRTAAIAVWTKLREFDAVAAENYARLYFPSEILTIAREEPDRH